MTQGRLAGRQAPGEDLIERVADRAGECAGDAGGVEVAAWAGDQHHSGKAGQGGQPALFRDRFAEHRAGEQGDEQGGDEDDGRGFGERQDAEGELGEQRQRAQEQGADDHQPRMPGGDERAPLARGDGNQHDDEMHGVACPDEEGHGVEGGQEFRAGLEDGEEQEREEEQQDAEDSG